MTFDAHVNFGYGTVSVAPSPALSGGAMTLAAGSVVPAVPFDLLIAPVGVAPLTSNAEIVRVTAMTGLAVTAMTRGMYGTSARTILVGDQCFNGVTKEVILAIEAAITAETVRATAAEGLLASSAALSAEATARASADALLATLASPALTGTPTAPTQAAGNNSTRLATTAYADGAVATEATARSTADALKAPLASPALTGTPTAPTPTALDASTKIATTAYADGAVATEASARSAADALLAKGLITTALKTANYSPSVNEFVPIDATSGTITVTLPTAPADKTRIGVKKIDASANLVTVTRGGTDVFNKAGGSTSVSLTYQNQGVQLQYESATGIWYAVADDIGLTALDSRYEKPAAAEVFAAAATGVAATDTAVLAAAISATPAGGTLWIDGHYKINAALAITQSITIAGRQKITYSGLSALPSGPNTLSQVSGSIIEQTVAATDGITCTIAGGTFHARDLVLGFTNGLASTGHGFNCAPSSNIVGVYGGSINDCYVFGHDGNHYALVRNNSLEFTTLNFRSWGGGGILNIAQGTTINYGNTVDVHVYVSLVNAGTAHGIAHSSATGLTAPASGGMLNLMTYIRPQVNIAGAAGAAGTQKPWSDTVGAGSPWYVTIISPDFESSGFTNSIDFGPGTEVIGAVYGTVEQLNTRVGYKALAKAGANAGTQQKSVAIGNSALAALTTGSANAAGGYFALAAATSGSSNSGWGYEALFGVTTGSQHVGVGSFAGQNATTCNYTTSIGYGSGPTGNFDGVTAIGNIATGGGANATALGYGASAGAAGSVAIGRDHTGTSATTSTQDEFVLGTALHTVRIPGTLKFTRTEGRNFVVPGTLAVAAGATNYIPPMFVNAAGLTATLTAVRYVIRAGTSATFKVQKNGVDMTGFTAIAATTTAATTSPTPVSVADGDAVAVVVTAVSGSPDSLTVELVFSYS